MVYTRRLIRYILRTPNRLVGYRPSEGSMCDVRDVLVIEEYRHIDDSLMLAKTHEVVDQLNREGVFECIVKEDYCHECGWYFKYKLKE